MRTVQLILTGLFIANLFASSASAQETNAADPDLPVRKLPRESQLLFHDSSGQVQQAKTVEEWKQRKQETLRNITALFGDLPGPEKRCPLDVQVIEETDGGSFLRRKISIQSEPGCRLPAYLLIPKAVLGSKTHLAGGVLCLHPTNPRGPNDIVGLGTDPTRVYGKELADKGYVVLAPAYPLLGEYQPDLKELGWKSGSLKAVWDNIRCLDLLDSLPEVKQGHYAAIGHSLGGHNSVYTALFDQRVQVVVSCCGLDAYTDYYGANPAVWEAGRGWTQERYIPRLARYAGRLQEIPFDFQEMISALAPRHVLIVAPVEDSNFRADSVDRVVAAAKKVYELHNAPNHLRCEHPPGGHNFPDEMREKAYQLIDEVIGTDVTSR